MKRLTCIMLLLLAAYGCDDNVRLPESAPQIIVEGWIESDGFPVVMVTTSVPVTETLTDISDLEKHIVNWAKVTVSDGENEIVLTGQKNKNYFPPYIYTTAFMRGRAGRTYSLKVEYSGRTVTATTTIPQVRPLEYIKVMRASDNKDLFYLIGGLEDDPQTKDYYKVFTKVRKKDSIYVSSFMGLTDDEILEEGINEIPVNNGVGRIDEKMNTYFSAEDFITVRFCTLDMQTWMYWSDYEEIQSLSSNPFFPISTDIRSNVKGGLGYWAGYGASYKRVSIPDSLRLGRVF